MAVHAVGLKFKHMHRVNQGYFFGACSRVQTRNRLRVCQGCLYWRSWQARRLQVAPRNDVTCGRGERIRDAKCNALLIPVEIRHQQVSGKISRRMHLGSERFHRASVGIVSTVRNGLGGHRVSLDSGYFCGRSMEQDSRHDLVVFSHRLRYSFAILGKELPRVVHKPFTQSTSSRICDPSIKVISEDLERGDSTRSLFRCACLSE